MAAGSAKQTRSVETEGRILAAAKSVLEEDGFDAFKLSKVATRADVAVGSIYHRIGSKEDLFRAVYDAEMAALHDEFSVYADTARWEPLDLDSTIEQAIEVMMTVTKGHAGFLRVAIARSMSDPEIIARGQEQSSRLAQRFEAVLLARRDEFTHPDPVTGVDACFRLVFATITRRITHGARFESPVEISDDALTHNLTLACRGILMPAKA